MTFIHHIIFKLQVKITTDHEIQVIYIYVEVNKSSHWLVIPKNAIYPPNKRQDTRQNHWTVKYRSCWLHSLSGQRSKVVSHWLVIPKYNIHPSNNLSQVMKNKSWPWNIGHCGLHSCWDQRSSHTDYYLKSDIHASSSQDTGHNNWTMKYRSWLRSLSGQRLHHIHTLSFSMTFIIRILFQIQGKITGPWNIDFEVNGLRWHGLVIQQYDAHLSKTKT